jgi:hypothetical protein
MADATYTNVWYKPIYKAVGVLDEATQWVYATIVKTCPGETVTLCDGDAAALGDHVEVVA